MDNDGYERTRITIYKAWLVVMLVMAGVGAAWGPMLEVKIAGTVAVVILGILAARYFFPRER